MAYVSGARPTSLDRKRARQRVLLIGCLIVVIGILVWGVLEYSTGPQQISAPAEADP